MKLAAPGSIPQEHDWEIGELLTVWWRPNFETFMVCGASSALFAIGLETNINLNIL